MRATLCSLLIVVRSSRSIAAREGKRFNQVLEEALSDHFRFSGRFVAGPLTRKPLDQLGPYCRRCHVENRRRIGGGYVPVTAGDFAVQLPRAPARVTCVTTYSAPPSSLAERLAQGGAAPADVHAFENGLRRLRLPRRADENEEQVSGDRSAEIHGVRPVAELFDVAQ